MSLGKKTLITLGLTTIGLMIALSLVISLITTQNYEHLEADQTRQHVSRAVNTLERDIDALRLTIQSWAAWDNTREFILGERPNYPVENNLIEQITITLRLNMMLFFDTSGDMVFGLATDVIDGEVTPVPKSMRRYLTRNSWLLTHDNPRDGYTGVALLPEGLLLVAAQPISSSNYESIVGTLVAARYIDAAELAHLQNLTELEIAVFRWDSDTLPAYAAQARSALVAGTDILVQPVSEQQIAGYVMQRDFDNQPAFLLQVTTPRPIYQAGQAALGSLLGALLIAGVIFSSVTMISMERLVLRRLTLLSNNVITISNSGNDRLRLTVTGRDELGHLGDAINRMLGSLEQAHRHEQEQSERARQQIEIANELKSKFIANMSHELRTPLNAIINFTYILKNGMRGPVTDRQVEYLDRVQASGEHLLGLINDILDLAKIEAGRMDLFKEEVQLGDLVKSTLSTAIGLTRDKPITLHHTIADNLPHVAIDKTRIRQVLLNLLSNAAKFTDAGSITVRVWQEGYALITSISDTGIGIPADKFATIFEEFRQADEGSARSYQGTGLGLPICQRLITMHGGRIWVESAVGVGSTFYFSLPLAVPPVVDTLLSLPLAGTEQGTVVLVIDDDPAAIDIVRTYLSQDGYSVYGSTDGRAALDEARQLCPVAIILDILLPYKDGWELLAAFKASPDLQPIPIICYTVVDDTHRGLALGASAYLLKPIQEEPLRQTVQQVVGMQAHILVIDDDPNVRELVPHYLSQHGYMVTTAANGREGLDQIAAQRPDLVLLDLMMPILDGFAVLETLEQQGDTRTIPVVALTAKDMTPDEQQYLAERVQSLMAKSGSTLTDVLAQVRTVLRQHQPAAPLPDTHSRR